MRARLPLWIIAAAAATTIFAGWVELGHLCGFGVVHPLPGTPAADVRVDLAVLLPLCVDAYAAVAVRHATAPGLPRRVRRFAAASAGVALVVGAAGQAGYHLLHAAGAERAPWPVTLAVSVLPVACWGAVAVLSHAVSQATTPVAGERDTVSQGLVPDVADVDIDVADVDIAAPGRQLSLVDAPPANRRDERRRWVTERLASGQDPAQVVRDGVPRWGCARRTLERDVAAAESVRRIGYGDARQVAVTGS